MKLRGISIWWPAIAAVAVVVLGAVVIVSENSRAAQTQHANVLQDANRTAERLRHVVGRAEDQAHTLAVARSGLRGPVADPIRWANIVRSVASDALVAAAVIHDGAFYDLATPGINSALLAEIVNGENPEGMRLYEPDSPEADAIRDATSDGSAVVIGPMEIPVLGDSFMALQPIVNLETGQVTRDLVLALIRSEPIVQEAGIGQQFNPQTRTRYLITSATPPQFAGMEGISDEFIVYDDGVTLDNPETAQVSTAGFDMTVAAAPAGGWTWWTGRSTATAILTLLVAWLAFDQLRRRLVDAERRRLREEEEAEREYQAAYTRKLEEINAVQEDLLAKISHELRTPMTVIRGFASVLRERGVEMDPEQLAVAYDSVARNSERLWDGLNGLLHLSERGPAANRQMAELAPIVREAAAALGIDAEVQGRGVAYVDALDLQQIVRSLLANAREYGGAPIRAYILTDDDLTCIHIEDHGAGVPDEFKDNLFVPFAQSSTGLQRTARGLGLGLPVTRLLAQRNGGEVSLSQSSSPTVFRVELPSRPGVGHIPPDPTLTAALVSADPFA